MNGIVTIYEKVIEILDDDDDFSGTVYGGPSIIRATAGIGEDAKSMKSPAHPNLLRARVDVQLLRVREGAGNPHLRDLLIAFCDKAKNNDRLRAIFGNRIVFVDDPDDPRMADVGGKFPWLGIKSDFPMVAPLFSGQREELLTINAFIYQQRFPKGMDVSLIGE